MRSIAVSINPSYLCNFRCSFCYLSEDQLSDRKKLTLEQLRARLEELKKNDFDVHHIDLYGGEIALLDESYLEQIHALVQEFFRTKFNVITNLSKINPYFLREDIHLSVSYDFEHRQMHREVFNNLLMLPRKVSILILASQGILKDDVSKMIETFNGLNNVRSVEIKPYSTNQANQHRVEFEEYEDFVKKWIVSDIPKNFEFINAHQIQYSLNKERNAFSDDHVYITPNGKFGVLEFDSNNHEFFLELDSLAEYIEWSEGEKMKVKENKFCKNCDFFGHCLTEHYRQVHSLEKSCNGFFKLLTWAKRS